MRNTMHGLLRAGVLAAAALAAAGCGVQDRLLTAPDPDLISPETTNSLDAAIAQRNGAYLSFRNMTGGAESTWLLGGMLADEWRSGDTFTERDETDKRQVQTNNGNVNTAYRLIHRTRLRSNLAIAALRQYQPTITADIAEMYLYRGWAEWQSGADFCNGQPFSGLDGAEVEYGNPVSSAEAFGLALASVDSGLTAAGAATDAKSVSIRNALRTLRGRILLSLNRPADAGTSVTAVPTDYRLTITFAQVSGDNQFWALNLSARRWTLADREGGNGQPFQTANDPRVPFCAGGAADCRPVQPSFTNRSFDGSTPFFAWLNAPTRETPLVAMSGAEARLIEAEAQLRAGNAAGSLATLNALRATTALYTCAAATLTTNASCRATGANTALPALTDAGSEAARVNQLFSERAFWLFARGTRLEDLRRMVRQYGRGAETVFPTGTYTRGGGGTYGTDVNFPVPQSEQNNPNFSACTNRSA
jgi:hypothetical protein